MKAPAQTACGDPSIHGNPNGGEPAGNGNQGLTGETDVILPLRHASPKPDRPHRK
ncbi:hypothetical protein [Synechococcus sp. Cu2B8-bc1011]|uniref:hypothetical protein n=1 Tax=Synechococcus sp. Cu2B8-bc1011 TaxID=3093725 RepID=UPI0039B0E20D